MEILDSRLKPIREIEEIGLELHTWVEAKLLLMGFKDTDVVQVNL